MKALMRFSIVCVSVILLFLPSTAHSEFLEKLVPGRVVNLGDRVPGLGVSMKLEPITRNDLVVFVVWYTAQENAGALAHVVPIGKTVRLRASPPCTSSCARFTIDITPGQIMHRRGRPSEVTFTIWASYGAQY